MARLVAYSAGWGIRGAGLGMACALGLTLAAPATATAGPWDAASYVGRPGYRPNGLGFSDVGKGLLALVPVDVQQPLQAAPSTRTDGFGAPMAFARRGDAVQFQNIGRDRQVALYGRDRASRSASVA
jgi:hypothetical protein